MPLYVQSRRNARGAGWHKRGYRDNGHMWLNIKEGSYGAVHGMDVNENSTVMELLNLIYRTTAMGYSQPLQEDWVFEVHSRRRALEASDDPVTTLFDGGETLIVKIFDGEGQQRVWDGFQWNYHVPGRPRYGLTHLTSDAYYGF